MNECADQARRAALAQLAILCGIAVSGQALAALAQPGAGARQAPAALSAAELALCGVLAELVIPRTDTPGALAAGVHRTIDQLLAVCALAPARQSFKAGLARVDAAALASAGNRFGALPTARQYALLRLLEQGASPFDADGREFFRTFKRYTVFAYYTSEHGATRELAWLPIPGGYDGTVKVNKATRGWAI